MKRLLLAAAAATLGLAAPAQAGEIFTGLYIHDVDTPLSIAGIEDGVDLQLGYRGGRIGGTPLQPYVFVAVNSAGATNYAAAGLSAKFGRQVYVRPGLGLAIHDGSTDDFQRTDRVAFGNRLLFEPELAIGAEVSDRISVEASWVHMSHGQLFGGQNPGMDNFGVRLNFRL